MSDVEAKSERGKSADLRIVSSAQSAARAIHRTRIRTVPVLITLATTGLAVGFGWALWSAYMETPWTRDGTVRVYTVTMAPEVAGRIVELPVVDNQFVAKGELLLVIDPTDYQIAVELAEAAVKQAQANVQNADAQIAVQQAQINAINPGFAGLPQSNEPIGSAVPPSYQEQQAMNGQSGAPQ